jgi:hypothetical protein
MHTRRIRRFVVRNQPRRIDLVPWLGAALLGVVWPTLAAGQRTSLSGIVRDSSGAPIPEADVSIASAHLLTRTNGDGAFSFSRLDAGQAEVSIRRLGFVPRNVQVDVRSSSRDTILVVLAAQALELPGIAVSEQTTRRLLWIEDFYRRRAKGIGGTYYTREDIEARHAGRLSDVLRDAPGVRFVRSRGGSGIRFEHSLAFLTGRGDDVRNGGDLVSRSWHLSTAWQRA